MTHPTASNRLIDHLKKILPTVTLDEIVELTDILDDRMKELIEEHRTDYEHNSRDRY